LYEVYWNLVELHGFDPDWFNTNPEDVKTEGTYKSLIDGKTLPRPARAGELGGNVIFFQLVVDGMKLQPCDPTFVEARDAILQADLINNNGENQCALWKGFAKRGLGESARYEGVDGFDLPASCQ
jgi:extracellular elastinolytic metalloproteinase